MSRRDGVMARNGKSLSAACFTKRRQRERERERETRMARDFWSKKERKGVAEKNWNRVEGWNQRRQDTPKKKIENEREERRMESKSRKAVPRILDNPDLLLLPALPSTRPPFRMLPDASELHRAAQSTLTSRIPLWSVSLRFLLSDCSLPLSSRLSLLRRRQKGRSGRRRSSSGSGRAKKKKDAAGRTG